jgi:hypothetical protein
VVLWRICCFGNFFTVLYEQQQRIKLKTVLKRKNFILLLFKTTACNAVYNSIEFASMQVSYALARLQDVGIDKCFSWIQIF